MDYAEKLQAFAQIVERDQKDELRRSKLDCEANLHNATVKVVPGRKYSKVDVGGSGKYMVDAEGNIYGIKAYGQIHRGHYYGTLDTVNEYYWGRYSAMKKEDGVK